MFKVNYKTVKCRQVNNKDIMCPPTSVVLVSSFVNSLSPTKWSDTLKQLLKYV